MAHDDDPYEISPWFLGPKAENEAFLEHLIRTVLTDYVHWRRNYFPSDRGLSSRSVQRKLEERYEDFELHLTEMMAELRRNFPFYSPRYLAHQLSDTTLPSLVGLFAGSLFNANNVTPEAAPVTVDWEIDACSRVLEMLGYSPPPTPPRSSAQEDEYATKLRSEFGWAHLTSGGTVANIEALWISRAVRYFPLAVRERAIALDIELTIKLPSHGQDRGHEEDATEGPVVGLDIREVDPHTLLLVRPNESIFLLSRFVDAVRRKESLPAAEASARASEILAESPYAAGKGFFHAAAEFPPRIFVSGAAHYSVTKAADILGVGRENVVLVRTDSMFRLDIEDLERKLIAAIDEGAVPVAVIAMAGTTEEGAIDPIHRVVELRERLERERDLSFWLHIDAAWGGYCRTLVCLDEEQHFEEVLRKVGRVLHVPFEGSCVDWTRALGGHLDERPGLDAEQLANRLGELEELARSADYKRYRTRLKKLLDRAGLPEALRATAAAEPEPKEGDESEDAPHPHSLGQLFELGLEDRKDLIRRTVCDTIRIEHREYRRDVLVRYGEHDVCAALIAFPHAESITVDPHKLGYAPYPAGVVAFRNDRVRHFVLEQAPYVTSARHDFLLHLPPRHLKPECKPEDPESVSTDAFAPFTLEGSRPGASAVALHLSTNVIPLHMRAHGRIIRSSLLAGREVYEWLGHWEKIARTLDDDVDYEFVRYQERPPDTNIVIFAVKKRTSRSLVELNRLTDLVYDRFTIQAELGEREYSYAQPFFLSRTSFTADHYPYASVKPLLDRYDIRNPHKQYAAHGLRVLRAAVMNPYITPSRQTGSQFVVREFVLELARAAHDGVARL